MKKVILGLVFLLAVVAVPSNAQVNPVWTAVASTGTIDEAALNLFTFGTTNLGFRGNTMGTIVARYNVVNIAGFVNPPWTTMEVFGYLDPTANGNVAATLWEVNPCTGLRTAKCTIAVSPNFDVATCTSCQIVGAIDFEDFLYYVEVTLTRNAVVALQANTLRIW